MKCDRRDFIKNGFIIGTYVSVGGCAHSIYNTDSDDLQFLPPKTSQYGYWESKYGLPQFVMPISAMDPSFLKGRKFHLMGNRALQMQAGSDGTIGIFEEAQGSRWLFYADDESGTGTSVITEENGTSWGTSKSFWPSSGTKLVFGCTWFDVYTKYNGLALHRRIVCPEGDQSWIFIEVTLTLDKNQAVRHIQHTENWQLLPRFLHLFESKESRDKESASVAYTVEMLSDKMYALEDFNQVKNPIGPPQTLIFEKLSNFASKLSHDVKPQPLLKATTDITMQPGSTQQLWFRIGRKSENLINFNQDNSDFFRSNLPKLKERLPKCEISRYPRISHEISWHAAALTGGANIDEVLGGHTLNQGSTYSFLAGGNAAARDSLQHAIPLVYIEPDLALSVLRNTCSWGSPDGDLPYALKGDKSPLTELFRPSDQNLWALWLAAEYGLATGDLSAFEANIAYHPIYNAEPVKLKDHLIRQYYFLVNEVGIGTNGHIRILNADWNDKALEAAGVDPEKMKKEGSSVLNSAMAAWVLPVFAALLDRLKENTTADHARAFASQLKEKVRLAWNGRWFHRAYAPDGTPVGDDACWLEVQPWAIICGAANHLQSKELLQTINQLHRANSPLGARLIWPLPKVEAAGMGTRGGIWYSINMTLIWAASSIEPDLAWDEWQKMSLHNHNHYKPSNWEGTLGGPDSWNSPESQRPGETWDYPWLSMQKFPVGNMHVHSQPILSYLRLMGIYPDAGGRLNVGKGNFKSKVLTLNDDGSGKLTSNGKVELATSKGTFHGRGEITF